MTPSSPILIAVADDHLLFRKTLSDFLESTGRFKVMLAADNGQDLLTLLEHTTSIPEICILDINMPKMNGYQTMQVLRQKWPGVKVLALSMFCNEFTIIKMIRLGASGFINKSCTPEELMTAIDQIAKVGGYYSEEASQYINDVMKLGRKALSARITEKEFKFLHHCCTDSGYKEIAVKLGVSPRTVEMYRDNLFDKLKITTRTGLALFAMKIGIVAVDECCGSNEPASRGK